MTRKFLWMAAATGLLLPSAARAQESSPAPASGNKPTQFWKIRCVGITSVALTADAMQSLPIQLVETLNCGDLVTVLSDVEGYTVKVRTADGKVGYVAGMNLMKAPPPPPPKPVVRVAPSSAVVREGVARWRAGNVGCEQFTSKEGAAIEQLTADGVTVQVSLRDTGAKLRAAVAVDNLSGQYVYISPIGISLETRDEHRKSLAYVSPGQLANEVATAQATNDPNASVSAGYKLPEDDSAFASAVYMAPKARRSGDDDPDDPKPSPALLAAAKQFNAEALQKGPLKPQDKTSGAVYFERDANPNQYIMRVPIDNLVFEFPLSLNQPQ
jgi:hypothetical protein